MDLQIVVNSVIKSGGQRERKMDKERQIKKLLKYFSKMQFTDILAFGNILGVKEEDQFEEYVTNILEAFSKMPAAKRRSLLKLGKDVSEANEEFDKMTRGGQTNKNENEGDMSQTK